MQAITIISQYFYPSLGATAQLMTDLARGLANRGYAVNVFTDSQSQGISPEAVS